MDNGGWKKLADVSIPPVRRQGFAGNVLIREPVPPLGDMQEKPPEPAAAAVPPDESGEDRTVLVGSPENDQATILPGRQTAAVKRMSTGETALMSGDSLVIGKSREADFTITDNETISRRHAVIQRRADGFYLSDLNSTNATYLNGVRIAQPVKLENGSVFQLSKESFQFMLSPGE